MKTLLLLIGILGVLLAAVLVLAPANLDMSALSVHGWIALIAGSVLSLAVGGGLMALVFHSARNGYDDRVARDEPPTDDRP